jgi:hypothetical protein
MAVLTRAVSVRISQGVAIVATSTIRMPLDDGYLRHLV